MSGTIKERYGALTFAANQSRVISNDTVGGFLAVTSGTITITRIDLNGADVPFITSLPVTAGVYTPIPFYIGQKGGTVTLGGGASGILAV